MYDKSVEYISGGSNVPEIKEFFWKWRRSHNPQTESSLQMGSGNLLKKDDPHMNNLGVFGAERGGRGRRRRSRRPRQRRPQALAAAGGGGEQELQMAALRRELRASNAGWRMAAAKATGRWTLWRRNADGQGRVTENGAPAGAADVPGNLVQPTVRKNFADTAKWVAALTTDKDGMAEIPVDMPENLTTWKIRVWGMGAGTRVGQGEAEVITRKDLIVRLQSPRFFVQKDEVVLSANVHNYLKAKKSAQVSLELEGKCLEVIGAASSTVDIDAGGEKRVDFKREGQVQDGQAIIRMKALTDVESDAMQMTFPVYVHGMLKMESWSGVIRPDRRVKASITMKVPARAACRMTRGSKSATRRRWPAPWSTLCRTWSTTRTAAPSRRSIASCRRS